MTAVAQQAPAVLKARRLTKRYGYRPVLTGLDLDVAPGEVVALFGPNGAGKTTLLRVVAGLAGGYGGELELFGEPVTRTGPAVRRRIGWLGHLSFCYEALTGSENLAYYAELYGLPQPRSLALDWLERVGLLMFAHEPVGRYSRGMMQRLALARCLMPSPDLLLLDEPATGLDEQGQRLLAQEIERARGRGAGIVLVTHDVEAGLRLADRAVLLAAGRVAATARRGEIRAEQWADLCRQAGGGGLA